MFTNNYIELRKIMFTGGNSSDFIRSDGAAMNAMYAQHSYRADLGFALHKGKTSFDPAQSTSNEGGGTYFGSGSTPPSKSDVNLENMIRDGISIANGSVQMAEETTGRYIIWASYTVTNTSDAPVTIGEIGYFGMVGSGSSSYYPVLMERTVLPEPVVIPVGGSKLITYKITINQTQ